MLAGVHISQSLGNVLIPLGSALLGASAGGLITGRVTRGLDKERREQREKADQREALLDAYWVVLACLDEMARDAALVKGSLDASTVYNFPKLLRAIRAEDRLILIRNLDQEGRSALRAAEIALDILLSYPEEVVGTKIPDERDQRQPLESSLSDFRHAIQQVGRSATAIRLELGLPESAGPATGGRAAGEGAKKKAPSDPSAQPTD